MAGKKKSTPISLQSLDALFGTTSEEQAGIQQIALDNLHSFSNHPFKVPDDDKMMEEDLQEPYRHLFQII